MATLYFNGASSGDWSDLANWWDDSGFSTPAASLPSSSDSVIASAGIFYNTGSSPTVVDFTLNDPDTSSYNLGIDITVTGIATFNDTAYHSGVITGNATFNDMAFNTGTIYGDATFNNYSYASGTISGHATFNDYSASQSGGSLATATFNDYSYNEGGVSSDATFNDSAYNAGSVSGDATLSYIVPIDGAATDVNGRANGLVYGTTYGAGSAVITEWVFSGTNNDGYVTGDATFVGSRYNNGTVDGDATFRDQSYNKKGIVGQVILAYDKGVNGSSILGIV